MTRAIEQELAAAKAADVLTSVFSKDVSLPVDLEKIAQKFSLTIAAGKFSNHDILGVLDREEKQIITAVDEPTSITAYTIACCIGHYVLHTQPFYVKYRIELPSQDEDTRRENADAEIFAQGILMPAYESAKLLKVAGGNTSIFAQALDVPEEAAILRLLQLGLMYFPNTRNHGNTEARISDRCTV